MKVIAQVPRSLLLLLLLSASATLPRVIARELQGGADEIPNIPPCNEVLVSLNKEEVKEAIITQIDATFAPDTFQNIGLRTSLTVNIKYGVQMRRLCSSCSEMATSESFLSSGADDLDAVFESFCGNNIYGSDVVYSAMLILPTVEADEVPADSAAAPLKVLPGSLKTFMFFHTTTTSFGVPSMGLVEETSTSPSSYSFRFDLALPAAVSAHGSAMLAPDFMGYGESYDTITKAYIVRKSYETSGIPLWFKAKDVVRDETDCATILADVISGAGYSEGGYSGVVIADLLHTIFGVEVINLFAGGAPFRIGSEAILRIVENIDKGTFANRRRHVIAYIGTAYSSTYTNMPSFNQGQDLIPAETRDTIIAATNLSLSFTQMNEAVPSDDPLSSFSNNFVSFARESIKDNNFDPCSTDPSILEAQNRHLLCQSLQESDLTETLHAVEYPVTICHSPDDELVSIKNVPDFTKNDKLTQTTGVGSHTAAGTGCLLAGAQYGLSDAFQNHPVESVHKSAGGCKGGTSTNPPTMAPIGGSSASVTASMHSLAALLAVVVVTCGWM